jgi:hypothetical protein
MEATPLRPGLVPAADTAPPAPVLADFLGGAETRLRDLLAFAMAAEGARAAGPATIETFRQKADAELHAHAFRLLHNQAEAIRQQAIADHAARAARALSFPRVVTANLVALALAALLAILATAGEPSLLDRLHDGAAQALARFLAGP